MSEETENEKDLVRQNDHTHSPFMRVCTWNSLCNKRPKPIGTQEYKDSLLNQVKRIREELEEFEEAVQEGDIENSLKEYIDLCITAYGAGFMLNMDVITPFHHVLDNNDLKYTTSCKQIDHNILMYGTKNYEVHVTYMPTILADGLTEKDVEEKDFKMVKDDNDNLLVEVYSIHRKSDDKVCKLEGHPSVDLSKFLPETE